jgi:cyclic pyranopterin phosphate synthase
MPEQAYVWLPRHDLLSFEEITHLARIFAGLGMGQLRLTGGEPLLRHDLPRLVGMLAGESGIADLAMTTNGVLLERHAASLREAGLHRLTVSLDTLVPARFRRLAGHDGLDAVMRGIDAARCAGFDRLKIDTVVLRGVNDDELPAMIAFGRSIGAEVRFIEYMDVGGATGWRPEHVVSRDAMLERLARHFRAVEIAGPAGARAATPAERFRLPDGATFGVIGSTTAPFCRSCERSRLTADGVWYLCLHAARGTDLRTPLRGGATDREIAGMIESAWQAREERGAELRLAARERGRSTVVDRGLLLSDPHLEMHTRGG